MHAKQITCTATSHCIERRKKHLLTNFPMTQSTNSPTFDPYPYHTDMNRIELFFTDTNIYGYIGPSQREGKDTQESTFFECLWFFNVPRGQTLIQGTARLTFPSDGHGQREMPCQRIQRYTAVASPPRLQTGTSGFTVMDAIHYAINTSALKTSLKKHLER